MVNKDHSVGDNSMIIVLLRLFDLSVHKKIIRNARTNILVV